MSMWYIKEFEISNVIHVINHFLTCNSKDSQITVHLGLKNYECVQCGKKFGQRAHWRRHKKTHD